MLGAATSRLRRMGSPPVRRQRDAHDGTGDQPAVDGEPTFPDRGDLGQVAAVVGPVEDDLVETGPDEPGDYRPLSRGEQSVRRKARRPSLAIGEVEAEANSDGDQDAIPPHRKRA
jgi:hypothetical protein